MLATHLAVEMLHAPAATAIGPGTEPGPAGKEAAVRAQLDRQTQAARPGLGHGLHPPLAWLGQHQALGSMAIQCALELGRQSAGVSAIVEPDIVDLDAAPTQFLAEVPHGAQE